MNVAGRVVTVGVCTYYGLVTGEVPASERCCHVFGMFKCESVLVTVTRIKAYDVVMCFDFFAGLILVIERVGGFAFSAEGEGNFFLRGR